MNIRRIGVLVSACAILVALAAPASWAVAQRRAPCDVVSVSSASLRVRGVRPLQVDSGHVRAAAPRVVGAILDVTIDSEFDVSPGWLEATLRADAATMRTRSTEMSECPFAVDGSVVTVARTSTGFRVEIRAADLASGHEVLRRAHTLFDGAS